MELSRILERVVGIGIRGGWAELQDTPLQLPNIQLFKPPPHAPYDSETSPSSSLDDDRIDKDSPQSDPPDSKDGPSS